MLVLTRKREESIRIGNDIVIKVTQIHQGKVKLGIEAPAHVRILRAELTEFEQAPAPVGVGERATDSAERCEPADSIQEDESEVEYGHQYVLEVEDVMMCVGAH
ncbi:carbon storage regulator [Schlesneria paludicola]|uniref:carbon storage regulator n=1 Tax=Schlesneria paludicola TaxID=360056 RepID=UPI00029A8D6A|nr:carbon storage regulator [Schlesneria paludicola]